MCRCRCLYINVTYQFVYLFHSPYGLFWINCHLDELAFERNVVWTTLNELSFGRILMDELSLGQIDVEPQEKSLITNAFNFIAELELIDIYLDIQPKRQQPFHTKYGKTFSRDDPKRK